MIITIVLLINFPIFMVTYRVDPDEDRNTVELIESRGYIAQTHKVETIDSYVLTIYRIVNKPKDGPIHQPVVLQHGLLMSSDDFLIASPGGGMVKDNVTGEMIPSSNLGFVLAAYGYDVWLPNIRGNRYSLEHKFIPSTDHRFWRFSYDEMIEYDVPAIIEYVLGVTRREKLAWIGHSQGGMVMFGHLSQHPEQSEKIKPFIGLAPVTRIIEPLAGVQLLTRFNYLGETILPNFNLLDLKPSTIDVMKTACDAVGESMCFNQLFSMMAEHINLTRLPVIIAHYPSGTSMRNVLHLGQNVRSGFFRKFNFGLKNYFIYGKFTPPTYNLSKIVNHHIILWSAPNDALSTPKGIQFIRDSLTVQPLADEVVPDDRYNHADFTFAANSGKLVYQKLIQYMNQYAE
ncbi:gastric triacylglycerol lipase-like [Brevipalpus obovatus]|uniref:gastric triacylglycerol lipase-like n=1 Tax=Brevipalpus obovatus TaxID=246614 RepID=UPI003D9F4094